MMLDAPLPGEKKKKPAEIMAGQDTGFMSLYSQAKAGA